MTGSHFNSSALFVVNGTKIQIVREQNPTTICWGFSGAGYVCKSTGAFMAKEKAELH